MLELNNVSAWYGPVQALREVTLSVSAGRITALLGNNGAGKSTLLKAVMGLLDPTGLQGSISFEGRELRALATEDIVRLGISYVPEGRDVFGALTVAENLAVGAYIRRDRKAVARDLAELYDTFPRLAERRGQAAGTLSGGEQQMLAMARALMNRPRLLLLDEPSLGLAPRLVDEVFALTARIAARGVTVLLVEQNATRALAAAGHGHVLEGGRVVLSDTAQRLAGDDRVRRRYLGEGAL